MLLRPRRPPPPAPPAPASPASPDPELRPAGGAPGTPPGRPASPGALAAPASPASPGLPGSPVSPGSAQRTPWSARETELLLGTLLQPAVWRALLLDRRQALPTYRRVSAALARQQVRRTPAQCRRRYKFLKDKLRDAQGQPPGPFDAQIRELMGLLGDNGHRRGRRRSPGPGRPPRGRRPAPAAPLSPAEPDAARDHDADPAWTLRFSPTPPKSADTPRVSGSPTVLSTVAPAPGRPEDHAPFRAPGSPPPPALDTIREDPDSPSSRPEDHASPQSAPPSLNAALLQTLGHLGDIVAILGPLRDQLLTLNQHVEQLRGSFDQTVSLAVGFILGSAAAERGVLADRRE
ncbi:PREDICTED: undifferentiated embryonic cell transcription factor 1 [Odobenus rosmarus divergens]|uniref:Undifferentiated embryonic cell transcription factor 1 n=1 Tax=Odobenus rosmarus divergens TaxID=9708 RepID=A0A2U3VJU7_ODORO|nr:PREDICTED: undifferentiated embryonic cell transcription factor 1 [Odobenus rosmarus divergens]